jgi:GAF domain-containing protein
VLTVVADRAARLCEADDVVIFRSDGEVLRLVAHQGEIPTASTLPVVRGTFGGRSVVERRAISIDDIRTVADEYPEGSEGARLFGFRTVLSVPLLREEEAIGVIQIRRTVVRPFTETQLTLLQTFAAQAVIAIENVRLFKELEARNRDLTESLEQQTATAEILRVIASSPTDLQPVMDAVAENAARVCGAPD